jgi:hypothetical protein
MSIFTGPSLDPADHDLKRRVALFLAGRHVLSLRYLEVEARGGTVTLRGRVGSFYEKQLSQQCCRRVAGVIELVDHVEVAERPSCRGRDRESAPRTSEVSKTSRARGCSPRSWGRHLARQN